MSQVTLEIPENLMNQLRNKTDSVQNILLKALEEYLIKEESNITTTQTWKLCGSLEINEPESPFLIINKNGELSTNYAENIDDILY